MKHILFVCSGNRFRSPMAEAFFNQLAEQQGLTVRATSAGLRVSASRASEKAIEVSKRYRADFSRHRPCQLDGSMVSSSDLVLTMEKIQADEIRSRFAESYNKIHLFREFIGDEGDFGDPSEVGIDMDQRYIQGIWSAVEKLVEKLLNG